MSSVVVADLTDASPNVYWELGVRQSFRHRTILVAQNGTELPFDINDSGTLFYDPDHLDVDDFCEDFKAAIKDCLENSERTDSHVLETLSGRGSLYEIIRRDETLRRLDAVLSECDHNLDMLKLVIERAKRNQDDSKNRMITTDRFRLWATESLVTNRYVDENLPFYKSVENYLYYLTSMNTALGLWERHIGDTGKYLLEQEKMTKDFKEFKGRIETVRDDIEQKQY